MYLSVVQTKNMSHTLEHDSLDAALKCAEITAQEFTTAELKSINIIDMSEKNWRCVASLRTIR